MNHEAARREPVRIRYYTYGRAGHRRAQRSVKAPQLLCRFKSDPSHLQGDYYVDSSNGSSLAQFRAFGRIAMGWLRHPKTTQERRANGKRSNFLLIDGYRIRTRPCRNAINLVQVRDDITRRDWEDRSWKRFRKTQYKS